MIHSTLRSSRNLKGKLLETKSKELLHTIQGFSIVIVNYFY